MHIIRESIFLSALRSFYNALFGLLGVAIGLMMCFIWHRCPFLELVIPEIAETQDRVQAFSWVSVLPSYIYN